MTMKQILNALIVLFALLVLNIGQAGDHEEITQLARDVTKQMYDAVQSRRSKLQARPSLLPQVIGPVAHQYFDFEGITRSAMGHKWKRATTNEKNQLTKVFSDLLIRTYGIAILNYSEKNILYGDVKPSRDGKRFRIKSTNRDNRGNKAELHYYVHKKNADWKIYDVKIEGISLVATYRDTFKNEIRKGGIQALIKTLRQKANAK